MLPSLWIFSRAGPRMWYSNRSGPVRNTQVSKRKSQVSHYILSTTKIRPSENCQNHLTLLKELLNIQLGDPPTLHFLGGGVGGQLQVFLTGKKRHKLEEVVQKKKWREGTHTQKNSGIDVKQQPNRKPPIGTWAAQFEDHGEPLISPKCYRDWEFIIIRDKQQWARTS